VSRVGADGLRVERLDVAYGDVQVLWGIDLAVREGAVTALLGSNGAGKTTLLRTVAGLLEPRAGRILWRGEPLQSADSVRQGIVMVPEGRKLFAGMTVDENVRMGAYARRSDRAGIRRDVEWVFGLFPELAAGRHRLAGSLSGGEQQMCAIGRALMTRPKLLMVDELSLGLAPMVVDRLVELLERARRETSMTMLIVEQDAQLALGLADYAYVLETGHIVHAGEPRHLMDDEAVKKAYLGL
jgi:branched-chain amino acid transport system ATP-binding protein